MTVLGIDPGTVNMGYGLVHDWNSRTTAVASGVLTASASAPLGQRLRNIYLGLVQLIDKYRPDAVAIEEPFVGQNVQAALAVGRAQAIAILAAANQGIAVYQYSPAKVKQAVTSHGTSSKEQVQEMVKVILKLPQAPQPDAADALAIALCHLQESRVARMMADRKAL
ncbi:MAG: crossover junction endodeoxyribonuclease RuvC [Chloroflexi bacterium]|nr:crossover junction endodeoxyribonuclease RuvC [Chloroflexota bacterium]